MSARREAPPKPCFPVATDSYAPAKPGAERPSPVAAVPLNLKLVLTYAEVAALGISPERSLRRLVAVGQVKRSVIRKGRRVRFVARDLIEELRQKEE